MTEGQRVRDVRKSLGLTMEKFGSSLGVGKTAISKIEGNERNLTDQMLLSICMVYNVNEEWLRSGTGEMFVPMTRDEQIEEFFGDVLRDEEDDFRRRLISVLAKLTPDEWGLLEEKLKEILGEDKK